VSGAVAVIPARGGSARIPRKNIRHFRGKPIIAWSIDAARASGLFDRVVVSTDDPEIAAVARSCGAEAPFVRPAELSDAFATTLDVIAHAVTWLRAHGDDPADVCCIYATAPFVHPADLAAARALLTAENCPYVFPATTFEFSVFRALSHEGDGRFALLFPAHEDTRSQDLPEAVHDAGQFYWGRAEAWAGRTPIYGPQSRILLIPRWRAQDIDTPEDWMRAELLHRINEELSRT
jgi:pseudaminic acid cytidylyltransferase